MNRVSFPVTVWFDPRTGQIEIARPTERGFRTRISDDPGSALGHPQLYRALLSALEDASANETGFAEAPKHYN